MALRLFKDRPPEEVPEMSEEDAAAKELNDTLDEMERMSASDCEPWWEMAADAHDYTFGNQLKNVTLKDGWHPTQVNYIFPALQQQLALLMQTDTRLYARPREDSDIPGAKVAEAALRWYYQIGIGVKTLVCKCALDGFLTGNWILLVYWNEKPEGGWDEEQKMWHGQVEVTLVPYYFFGVAPGAETLADAEWVFIKRQMYVDEAKQRWPEYAEKIDKAALLTDTQAQPDWLANGPKPTGWKGYVGPDTSGVATNELGHKDKPKYYGRLAAAITGAGKNKEEYEPESERLQMVTVMECWFKDRTEEETVDETPISDEELEASGQVSYNEDDIPVLTETGEPLTEANRPTTKREYDRPLYPNGRRVLRIGRIALNAKADKQRWDGKTLPFITGPFIWLPHTWRGVTGVEMVREPQDMVNEIIAHVVMAIRCFGDPRTVVELGALPGAKDDQSIKNAVKNAAGKILVVNPNKLDAVRREPPPPLSADLFAAIKFFDELIRTLHGIHEIAQGKRSGGRLTATELLKLDQNSRLRTILLSGDLERTTGKELMTQVWELIVQHMSVGDMVRIVGEGGREDVIKIKGEYVDPDTRMVMKSVLDAKFDLDIQVGSELPADKQREKEEALQLLQAVGPAYLPRLLETYGVPNLEEILNANEVLNVVNMAQQLDPALLPDVMAQIQEILEAAVEAQKKVEQGATQGQSQGGEQPAQEPAMV